VNAQIQKAIAFSMEYMVTGQVAVKVAADEDILDVLADVDYDGMTNEEDGSYEVWGCDNGEGWRINVTLLHAA